MKDVSRVTGIKDKLQGELDELETELRIHLHKEIKRALEFGELRENSEYRAALDPPERSLRRESWSCGNESVRLPRSIPTKCHAIRRLMDRRSFCSMGKKTKRSLIDS
jgi:hypothetical protein